ncbi:TPA: hypothetical protein DEP21_02485 [Patescibacteria group bacterium]|nr:hypothetical protein [Candidatus Gracilibacteria bacterium]
MIRQKFWKNHSHGQKEGFGLGLYLVKLLVEKHNWSIDMTSDADH